MAKKNKKTLGKNKAKKPAKAIKSTAKPQNITIPTGNGKTVINKPITNNIKKDPLPADAPIKSNNPIPNKDKNPDLEYRNPPNETETKDQSSGSSSSGTDEQDIKKDLDESINYLKSILTDPKKKKEQSNFGKMSIDIFMPIIGLFAGSGYMALHNIEEIQNPDKKRQVFIGGAVGLLIGLLLGIKIEYKPLSTPCEKKYLNILGIIYYTWFPSECVKAQIEKAKIERRKLIKADKP